MSERPIRTVDAARSFAAIVPTFNRRKLVGETLQSLRMQSRSFDEIFLVDDGSTDGSVEYVRAAYGTVSVLEQGRRGVQAARNAGARAARSTWLVLCDSDDLLHVDYLATLDRVLGSVPELDAVYVNFDTFGEGEGVANRDKFGQAPLGYWESCALLGPSLTRAPNAASLLRFQPLFPTGLAIRRSAFEGIGGFDPRLAGWKSEDLEFTLRVVERLRTGALHAALARIRKHADNDSRDFSRQLLGESDVLDFFRQRWAVPELHGSLSREAERRRWDALDWSVSHRDWRVAAEAFARVSGRPPSLMHAAKFLLAGIARVRYPGSVVAKARIESGLEHAGRR